MIRPLALAVLVAGCGHSTGDKPDATGAGSDATLIDAEGDAMADATANADAAHFGPDQVWFGSEQTPILHYDGTSITPTTSAVNTYYGMWGTSPTNLYALTWNGEVDHFDGATWTPVRTATGTLIIFREMTGFGPDDIWALGGQGTILRYDGTTWTTTVNGTISNWAAALWGTSSSNMWAMGYSPTSHHWDGAHWQDVPYVPGMYMFATWGSAANDIWAVGQTLNQGSTPDTSTIGHYDGSAWARYPVPADLNQPMQVFNAVWGAAADDVWAVGNAGLVAHWNGATWSKVDIGTTADLQAVSGSWAGSVWVAGRQGTIRHRDAAGTWSAIASNSIYSLYTLWVAPAAIIE